MHSLIHDRVNLILFSIFCALVAWGFWFVLGRAGFYVIGAILFASYAKRIWDRFVS